MIDRRKIAVLLLVLGAALAVVAGLQNTYRTVYRVEAWTTTLWIATPNSPNGREQDAYYAAGWPVTIAAVLMVVAAVLVLRERTAFVGKPLAMGAAGALAATVFMYLQQLRREAQLMSEWPLENGQGPVLTVLGGTYLLGVAAVIGLAGAVLAQRKQEEPPPFDAITTEDGVVIHQIEADDSETPPYGFPVLVEPQEPQEPHETAELKEPKSD